MINKRIIPLIFMIQMLFTCVLHTWCFIFLKLYSITSKWDIEFKLTEFSTFYHLYFSFSMKIIHPWCDKFDHDRLPATYKLNKWKKNEYESSIIHQRSGKLFQKQIIFYHPSKSSDSLIITQQNRTFTYTRCFRLLS